MNGNEQLATTHDYEPVTFNAPKVARSEALSIPVGNDNFRARPEAVSVSLPDMVTAGAYYGGEYIKEGMSAGQDLLGAIKDHGVFYALTIGGAWALGKVKAGIGIIKRALSSKSPYGY